MSFGCPDCGKQMLEIRRLQLQVEVCPSCQAAWFDTGELASHLNRTITMQPPAPSDFVPESQLCPHCSESMRQLSVLEAEGALVQRCSRHGLFVTGENIRHLDHWAQSHPLVRAGKLSKWSEGQLADAARAVRAKSQEQLYLEESATLALLFAIGD